MSMDMPNPPLFGWRPPCKVIAFPLEYRVGKVRDVARKMIDKSTDRHAVFYQRQVTEALVAHLDRLGIPQHQQDEQIVAFWRKVENEIARISCRGTGNNDPRGAA